MKEDWIALKFRDISVVTSQAASLGWIKSDKEIIIYNSIGDGFIPLLPPKIPLDENYTKTLILFYEFLSKWYLGKFAIS